MKKLLTILLLVWVLPFTAVADKPIQSTYVAPNMAFSEVMKLPFRDADAKISYGDDPLQYGLLWQANHTSKKPLVVLIHGGCWLNAFGVDHAQPMASAIADAGFDVWAIEYRRTGDQGGGWPGSFEDVQKALAHVSHLPDGINREQVILLGHSAGGHLALLAQVKNNSQVKVVKTVGLAAITDLVSYAKGNNSCQSAGPKFMAGTPEERPDAYRDANPKQYEPYKNTLLLQGHADVIVPEAQAQLKGAEVKTSKAAGHFDWIHPKSEAFDLLLKQLKSITD